MVWHQKLLQEKAGMEVASAVIAAGSTNQTSSINS
jgi:hypothetical protein